MAIQITQLKSSWNEWYLLLIGTLIGFGFLVFLFFIKSDFILGPASPSPETVQIDQSIKRLLAIDPSKIIQDPSYRSLTSFGNVPINLPSLGKQNPFVR